MTSKGRGTSSKAKTIEYAKLTDLFLDPTNPRLGRKNKGPNVTQEQVLGLMEAWELEELAVSFLESGYWPQEAVIVTREKLYNQERIVVIEGNRRIAALKKLITLFDDKAQPSGAWVQILEQARAKPEMVQQLRTVPCIEVDSRDEVQAFLGFRHVSGIKEWKPAEKAEFIAHLIDHQGLDYEAVRRRIGSKTETVRRHYITYRLLQQMESLDKSIDVAAVEERFSVLYLSLRAKGVQDYLQVNIQASPEQAKEPVLQKNFDKLVRYVRWVFGDSETEPLFTDSRKSDTFGKILESPSAVQYLETAKRPSFDMALRKAGGDEAQVAARIDAAADEVEQALSTIHQHKKADRVIQAVNRLAGDMEALLKHFPDARKKLSNESTDAHHS